MNKIENTKKTVNITALFCVCVLITFCFCMFMPVNGEQEIYNTLIRLHVLPNSDSEDDQNLKLEVRDYILGDIAALTEDCSDVSEATEKIQADLNRIERKIKDFINQKGYDYEVKAKLSKEVYPERTYTDSSNENYSFPSGVYQSFIITIGEGSGNNWWCVLFPPICLSGSTSTIEEELAVAGYSSEQINILKKDKNSKYVVRFKILEILSDLFR